MPRLDCLHLIYCFEINSNFLALSSPQQKCARSTEVGEEGSAPQTANAALSNGSSQSKRPKRNVRSTYLRDSVADATSPINSQGGVTSSSPDEVLLEENGVSTVHVENRSKGGEAAAADTAGPVSPAVIDAEHHESKFKCMESSSSKLLALGSLLLFH